MHVTGHDFVTCNYTDNDRLHIAENDSMNCKNRKLFREKLIKCKDRSKRIQNHFKIIVFLS